MPDINIGVLVLQFVVFLFSLTLHEAAHAWTSERFGDSTGRYLGRVSLNPLVHIDIFGTVIFPLMGMITGMVFFGWAKPVPVDPSRWRDHVKANIAVSAAGPLANVLIAVIALGIIKILLMQGIFLFGGNTIWSFIQPATPHVFYSPLATMLCIAVIVNVGLAIFNLIPIPPLDGSHIFSSILSMISREMMEAYEGLRSYGMILLILFVLVNRELGLLGYIFLPVWKLIGLFLNADFN